MNLTSAARSPYWIAAAVCALAAVVSWQILVVREDLRLLAVFIAAGALLLLCISRPRLTLLLTMSWLPFLGLIRRVFDPGGPPGSDPLLLVVPTITSILAFVALWGHRSRTGSSRGTLLVGCLLVALVLAVFNPTQGSILAGLSGTIFLFFPVLWFFLGRAFVDDETAARLLWITVWTGAICAGYGIYQVAFGFLSVEERWVANRDFAALYVGRFIRPFSTFPSPEEWSRHLMITTTVAMGLALARWRREWWLAAVVGVCVVALLLCGVRISAFGLILSVGVLLWAMAVSRLRVTIALAVLAVILVMFVWLAPVRSADEVHAERIAWSAFFGHSSRGIVAPLSEDTLWARTELWWELFTDIVPHHPLGMGLSVPTLGASRFDARIQVGTESYAASVFVAAGFPAGLLLLAVFWVVMRHAISLCRRPGTPVLRIGTAVVAGIVFTSIFGNSLALYTIGPLGWSLMGWLAAREPQAAP